MSISKEDKKLLFKIFLIIVFLVLIPFFLKTIKRGAFIIKYYSIWNTVVDGKYYKARADFKKFLKDESLLDCSKNIYIGVDFCDACIYYTEKDYRNAKPLSDKVASYLERGVLKYKINKKHREYIDEMIESINEKYSAHKADYDEEDRIEKIKSMEHSLPNIPEVPCVGMPEKYIDRTDLGKHSRYDADTSTYYWIYTSYKYFSAECDKKKVVSIYDGRENELGSGSKKNNGQNLSEFDADEYDIDSYYDDNKDEGLDDVDDAYDDFEDDSEFWDDY